MAHPGLRFGPGAGNGHGGNPQAAGAPLDPATQLQVSGCRAYMSGGGVDTSPN